MLQFHYTGAQALEVGQQKGGEWASATKDAAGRAATTVQAKGQQAAEATASAAQSAAHETNVQAGRATNAIAQKGTLPSQLLEQSAFLYLSAANLVSFLC